MSVDLTTRYLGLDLANPLVVAPCPLTGHLDTLKLLEDAGAAAVVLPSLFEEQLECGSMQLEWLREFNAEAFATSLGFFPMLQDPKPEPDSYLEHIEKAKRALSIPVVASINGTTEGGWTTYASLVEQAGADALELNEYLIATDPDVTAQQIEQRYLNLVMAVRAQAKIPLAVKVGPYFSSFANMARRIVEHGADGLVLFNRFLQPDIDLETRQVTPTLQLSQSHELLLPLRWIAILRGRVEASLSATSGVYQSADVIKLLFAGADAVMTASSLLTKGPGHLKTLTAGIGNWMEEHEFSSVSQLKGSMCQINCSDPAAFERANYMKALASYTGPFS